MVNNCPVASDAWYPLGAGHFLSMNKPGCRYLIQHCIMKLILACLFIFISCQLFSQPSRDEKQIRDLLRRQTEAWNRGNLDDFMEGYWHSDSLLFIGKNGVINGFQPTLDRYKKAYSNHDEMGTLVFDIVRLKRLSPEYYWVLGKWFLKRNAGNISGYYTLLFRKIGRKWQIISDHSS